MKRLLLVRHGESIWNATRRLQGQADMPLSERGITQARALAALVQRLAPDQVMTSDLMRARQTADLLGYPDARHEPSLREADLGEWTGREIGTLDRADYLLWRAGQFAPRNGEIWSDFRTRTKAVVTSATDADRPDKTVLMVCHGGVIRALLDGMIGLSPDRLLPVRPASLTILSFRDGQAKLEAMNITVDGLSLDAPD